MPIPFLDRREEALGLAALRILPADGRRLVTALWTRSGLEPRADLNLITPDDVMSALRC